RTISQKTFHDKSTNNVKDSSQSQKSFIMKNSYYKKFCHDFSDFSDDFLQEDFYSSEIDYNLADNKSFFNNNAECYNCDVKFSSNNQLVIEMTQYYFLIKRVNSSVVNQAQIITISWHVLQEY